MTTGVLAHISAKNGWEWKPLWAALQRSKEAGSPNLQPLSVFLDSGVVPRSSREDNHNQLGEDLSKYLVVRPGDVVFNKLRTWQGGLGVSLYDGIVSPAYFVCRPIVGTDSRFVHYLLKSRPYLAELVRISKWMPPSQFDTPWENLRRLPLLIPELDEQRRISDFLDAETAQIDRLVALRVRQRDLISLRQRVATESALAQCSSGAWTRIKYLFRVRPRYGVLVPVFEDEGVPFIRVNDLQDLSSRASALARIPATLSGQYPRTIAKSGDVLVSVVGTLGKVTVVPEELIGANVARAVCSIRLRPGVDPNLFAAWIATSEFERQALLATGSDSAQPTLGMEDLANFSIRWPADPGEQQSVARRIEEEQKLHRELIQCTDRQLALLAERRQALITAAVTGQLDVTTARPSYDRGL